MASHDPYAPPSSSVIQEGESFYQPHIFSLTGRIGRLRYLAYGTGLNLVMGAAMMLFAMVMGVSLEEMGSGDISSFIWIIMGLLYLVMLVLFIGFGKRRLNDMDRTGWWLLLMFVPLLNLILLLVLIFARGTSGVNDYGPQPVKNSIGVIVLGLALPVVMILGIVAAIAIPFMMGAAG